MGKISVPGLVPWFPASLAAHGLVADDLAHDWCYVLLADLEDGLAVLERWAWPYADREGRLDWPQAAVLHVAVPVEVLTDQLYRPGGLVRSPRVSDVLAVRGSPRARWRRRTPVTELAHLFPDMVVDVSADARLAAKLAFQGAVVTSVPVEEIVEPGLVPRVEPVLPAPVLSAGDRGGRSR